MYDVETLELPKVLNEVQKYASSPLAKIKLSSLEIKNDIEEIRLMLEETEEARLLQIKYGELPFGGLFDLTNVINRLRLKSVLSITDFLDLENMLYCTRNILSFNQTNLSKEKVLYLNSYFSLLNPLKKVSEKINNIINENGEIYDHASDELASIRKKIKTLDNQVRAKMQELLQTKAKMLNESLIVIRNDRMCLCVKSEYKHVLKGIIHDESSSGSTVYIEPYSALEISNRLVGYKEDEKREINKILSELSQFVWAYYEEIRTNYENLTILDVIYAKAKYAIYHNAYKPEVNDMGIIDLKLARHPLIPQDRCVPINVKLGDAYQAIIITGPNTGGKTVALKTTGLLTLMTQCGLLIPANEGSKVAIFKQILADIGDEQSIEQSLSSFSAHMTKVIKILNNLGHKALVLFDELGSGTDPKEGSNLAIAITEYLLERNARIIVTTHYADLKAFAYHNDKVINASVEFDTATLKPTYRLLLGIPGSSNALTIAKRLGLNEEIVLKANDLNTENESDLATMLRHLDEENTRLTKEIKAYEEKNQEVNLLKEKLTKKEAEYDAKYQSFLKKSQAEANRILEKAKQFTDTVTGEFVKAEQPYIVLYYKAIGGKNKEEKIARLANVLAHEYMHYMEYRYCLAHAVESYQNEKLSEAMADFFGVLYVLQRKWFSNYALNEKANVAEHRYNEWVNRFGTCWPYAKALHFYTVCGNTMKFSDKYCDYEQHGSVKKLCEVFGNSYDSMAAYNSLLYF